MKPEPEGFAEFWAVWRPYRRKSDSRKDAAKAFGRAVDDGHSPADLARAAALHIASLKEKPSDLPYIQLAATWLHKECFVDVLQDEADRVERLAKAAEMDQRRARATQTTAFLRSIQGGQS